MDLPFDSNVPNDSDAEMNKILQQRTSHVLDTVPPVSEASSQME